MPVVISALLMLKNEEESIAITIHSLNTYINHIIVYDTGSTDRTISIIQEACAKNGQTLYLKQVQEFHGFPQSRNEAIEFAETIPTQFVLMLDAGDEFKTNLTPFAFLKRIHSIKPTQRLGVVKQLWLELGNVTDHSDLRFIRTGANCRYDLEYPVHEKFIVPENEDVLYFGDEFHLYQDRDRYGGSTDRRYARDIELLSAAKPGARNYYFLGQTYANIKDFANALKYTTMSFDILKHKPPGYDNTPINIAATRMLHFAIKNNSPYAEIERLFKQARQHHPDSIDPYVLFFDFCVSVQHAAPALPYLDIVANMEMRGDNINHNFYTYDRWRLISILCLASGTKRELGKEACKKAIAARNLDQDKMILGYFS